MTILTVTLNAAIDKRYDLPHAELGTVQRVTRVSASAGGKGLNVARGALSCGQQVVATGFVGGFAGEFVTSTVRAMGIRDEFVGVPGETRTCINIIDSAGVSTEFLEPGVCVSASDLADLTARFTALLPDVDVVTLSGSAPLGCPDDVYVGFVRACVSAGRPVVLDTSGDLLAAGLAAAPTVVKPNRQELAALTHRTLDSTADLVAACRHLCQLGAEWVVVSLGGDGAIAVNPERAVQVRAPRVVVQNPVGCGDVLVAGLASGLAAGLDVPAALPHAVQVATAAAAHAETGTFDPAFAESLDVTTADL
ncbi:MAG: 1-phosphofructokinase family hexose kinase [Micropruina sp.]|nr:1-phosphofructokinase family hexose kinase [Micropruina sp.]